MPKRKHDRIGFLLINSSYTEQHYGKWTTLGPVFYLPEKTGSKVRHAFQVCQCECGTCKIVKVGTLKRSLSQSCGCERNKLHKERRTTHGHAGGVNKKVSGEYAVWHAMRRRCYGVNTKAYPDYGGRGIKVCDRWLEPDGRGFMNFLEDMGRRPSPKHSIDRIDVNGNYEPRNCRWATRSEQNRNRRDTRYIEYNGQKKSLTCWSEQTGLNASCISFRLKSGWSVEDALTKPSAYRKPNT
jgi:hypothetical protein